MTRRDPARPSFAITGANGWLGRRLVRALTAGLPELGDAGRGGHAVRCLVPADEKTDALRGLGAEIVSGDIRDLEACHDLLAGAGGAVVFHIAGVIHPSGTTRDFEAVNVGGAENILAAARRAGARRLVAMSSNSPLGANSAPDAVFTEESPYNPYMGYGRSKHRMELQLKQAMGGRGGPEIVIVRAPWFYGPGQPPRQTLFFRMIKEGRFPILGTGLNRRSMGYVDSLALGMLLCASTEGAAGETYWLADSRPYSMIEIVDTVRAVLRDDFGIAVSGGAPRVPAMVADAARLADAALQAVGLYHQKIHVLSEMNLTIACDIGKARRELGYAPLVDLREGMRRSVQWCLDNGQTI